MKKLKIQFVFMFCFFVFTSVGQMPFTSGNIVVMRIGNGSTPLASSAYPLFLDEYSPSGILVQSLQIPVEASGSNNPCTLSGLPYDVGAVTLSPDKQWLAFTGVNAVVGTPDIDLTSFTNRTIGLVNSNGNINTSTVLTDAGNGSAFSAVTLNGNDIWACYSNGIRYTQTAATTSVSIATGTFRVLNITNNITNNQLYTSSGSSTVRTVGTGLPTTSGQIVTTLPGLSTGAGIAQYFFADLHPGIPGNDVLYLAVDNSYALRKYSFNGTSWISNGSIGVDGDDYRGITGIVSGTTAILYITRKIGTTAAGGGEFVTFTDVSGHGGTLTGSPTVLATANFQTAFRGIALVPSADYYRSKQAGDWSDVNTWEASPDKTTWSNASSIPNQSSKGVTIANAVTVNGTITAGTVTIDNGGSLAVSGTLTVNTNLHADGSISIAGGGLLRMAYGATITGTSSSNYIVTNTSGSTVGKVEFTNMPASAKVFPIGTATHYMPVTITPDNAGATFSAGVFEGATQNGAPNGTAISSPILKNIVNASWQIDRSVTTPSATVTFSWNASQEGTGFAALNNSQIGAIHYNGTGYDLPAGTGDNTANTVTASFSTFSPFVIGTTVPQVALKTFLQGAYNTGAARHKDVNASWASVLNTHALSQPYSGAPFSYAGTESVTAGFFTSTVATTDITDWVLLDLRDATTPTTVVKQRAAFVREDGLIVDLDGTSNVVFAGVAPGNYFLNIRHRNHLSVRTSVVIATDGTISATPSLYDLTTAQTQAFQNGAITTNAAMKDVTATTVFGMWAGNANSNTTVRYTGLNNDSGTILSALGSNQAAILSGVYNNADLNMDGIVRYTGLNNDSGVILSVLGSNQAALFTQH